MRRFLISALLVIASTAAFAAPAVDNSPILGVWKAQTDSLPMMTLTVSRIMGS